MKSSPAAGGASFFGLVENTAPVICYTAKKSFFCSLLKKIHKKLVLVCFCADQAISYIRIF